MCLHLHLSPPLCLQTQVVGNDEVNLKIHKEEQILHSSMPDNPTFDENDGGYRTFEGISRKTSSTKEDSISVIPKEGLTWRKDCNRSFGLLLALLSGVMMTTYSSLIKTLEEMDVMQVVVIRGLLQVSVMGGLGKSDQTN